MKKVIFKGCGTAIVTPFNESGDINVKEFEKIVEFQIENGANAIVVCGTTGESATLLKEERKSLIKFCVDTVNKRIPVIAGVGSNSTKVVLENIKIAQELGVDGLLVVTPYYNKTTQEGLIKHFKVIAESTKLPIILYNVPSRTGVDIKIDTYVELSKIENIVGVKEASGDISKILKIRNACKENLAIYSGNDDQIIPTLSLGGSGVISVLSNIKPQFTVQMINEYWNGNIEKASNMQIEVSKLIDDLFKEANPIPIKEAMNIIGFKVGKPRMPLVECSKKLSEEIKNKLI